MSISICRTCAELAVEVIDEEERRRRGENPAGLKRSTVEMIEVCITTLNHFESLSRKREFTEAELKIKQWIESELERLSDGT